MQAECFTVKFTHIIDTSKAAEIVNEMLHFFVRLVVVERNNRNAIIDLECE